MSNKLEGFVKENKKAFEENGPSDKLWDRIEAELDKKDKKPVKKIKLYQWMSIAAAFIIGFGIYFTYNTKQSNNEILVADINPDYAKKAVHFTNLIEEKRDSLQLYSKENPDLFKKFVNDLKKLDANYQSLKKELQTSPNPDVIVKQMMRNLEIQANILSRQLLIINQVNQYKEENTI